MNTLIQSSARVSRRSGGTTMSPSRVSQHLRRTYATQRPTLPEGSNKPLMIAAIVGIPALTYFMLPSRPAAAGKPVANPSIRPNLDPAARKRDRDSHESDEPKYVHPEHKNPDEFKSAFGQLHQQKRVDSPPDRRHHQALNDKARVYD
ncbi:hypothetical protein F5B22DRAFT_415648 [Xylaria bambusicola]|uniref:uncharacterized protein n=1 Tax=Xylaria bambusicola TaxID=326684 RepID=UPI0020082B93|nr:uncharacterized protein F5B22DRAFT_415648 [Xylaria bambusicola]KAI0523764.1 hypothetical protein F5B22DRAFT_415648 [Xylaria bambusicola]